jgi:hypothetical protein
MSGSVLANIELVAATLVVIWYGRQAVRESSKATTAAEKTVTKAGEIVGAVRDLLAVAQRTAASSDAAAGAAKQTMELASAARHAD